MKIVCIVKCRIEEVYTGKTTNRTNNHLIGHTSPQNSKRFARFNLITFLHGSLSTLHKPRLFRRSTDVESIVPNAYHVMSRSSRAKTDKRKEKKVRSYARALQSNLTPPIGKVQRV